MIGAAADCPARASALGQDSALFTIRASIDLSSTFMDVTPQTAVSTSSAVLALSKAAWKLGSSLSKLDQGTEIVDFTIKDLAGEVKSLGNECDLLYAELEAVADQSNLRSPLSYDIDSRLWNCLISQVEGSGHTIQELGLFIQSVGGEESTFVGQAQRQRKLDTSKDQISNAKTRIRRHTDNLHTTLLLVNTWDCTSDRWFSKLILSSGYLRTLRLLTLTKGFLII